MRLLIADDSEILRSRLVDMLSEIEDLDIVGEAADFKEALRAIDLLKPDVVILDIRMPGEEGIIVLEDIKKIKEKGPMVIVFTNFPYFQYRKRCLDAGADFFFYKAVEFEKLLELIGRLSRKR
jgi:DNA-binding NarL/FixJ family response regulator